jgi:putative transposase
LDGREPRHCRTAFDQFSTNYETKYPKAAQCLAKDLKARLTFYDFPAEHWIHIRTTNPIESTFATVRLRTAKTRGCVSRASILAPVFKLAKSAEQRWRKLKGAALLAQVVQGVRFKDGLQEEAQRIAAETSHTQHLQKTLFQRSFAKTPNKLQFSSSHLT